MGLRHDELVQDELSAGFETAVTDAYLQLCPAAFVSANSQIRIVEFGFMGNASGLLFRLWAGASGGDLVITNISAAAAAVVTTSAPHGLSTGHVVNVAATNSTPSINGLRTVTVLSPTTFSVAVTTSGTGNTGGVLKGIDPTVGPRMLIGISSGFAVTGISYTKRGILVTKGAAPFLEISTPTIAGGHVALERRRFAA